MNDYQSIIYETSGPVAVITLNRPQVLNAMNRMLWVELADALEQAEKDEAIKSLIVTGAGRAFSTGADLKESKNRDLGAYRAYLAGLQETTRRILRFEKPIIAAINGYALGSGYELALACDIRIAAEDAQIGSPEARVNASVTGGRLQAATATGGPRKSKGASFYRREYFRPGSGGDRTGKQSRLPGTAYAGVHRHGRENRAEQRFFY